MLVSMRSVVLAILVVIFCISQIGGEDIEKQPASKTIAETDVFINNASIEDLNCRGKFSINVAIIQLNLSNFNVMYEYTHTVPKME
ncbi:hypothetical protein GWI33_020709 [Rhynchophorus ferrugineus]|uniref:Uncharacterized protein n=1 Tax=Rhynchophorus ferrugineus TaxID=354439 RepID=A0A834HRY1_RHYFE|nr:hypothetical protein GWI33_020709 [Rhynchophorus ferrugineus]